MGYRDIIPRVENPMEKERQHEMETGVMQGASEGS